MPFEGMNLQGKSAAPAPCLLEEVQFPGERQVGLWKPDPLFDPFGMKIDWSSLMPCCMPLELQVAKCVEAHDIHLLKAQKSNLDMKRHEIGANRVANQSSELWSIVDIGSGSKSEYDTQPSLFPKEGSKNNIISAGHESGKYSSSLSELLSRKLRFPLNSKSYSHSVDSISYPCEENILSESPDEVEAQTIGNLLPDDDDLFSGVVPGIEPVSQPGEGDTEDLDLFCNVGGMDLGGDISSGRRVKTDYLGGIFHGQLGGMDASITGEHPCEHSSRTLSVRNINSRVEDAELRTVFEQYGDISSLYTACKHRGLVMVSYYDIRSAENAMKALQSKLLRDKKLDIHFSIPKDNPSDKDVDGTLSVFDLDSSISNNVVCQIFGIYGEIKEIREAPITNTIFVEFFDVRAAAAALRALNRAVIAGKRIKLESSRPRVMRSCSTAKQLPPDMVLDEAEFYKQCVPGSFFKGPITSSSMKNEIGSGSPSENKSPFGTYMENAFQNGISSSVPSCMSSFLRTEAAGNQPYFSEAGSSFDQFKYKFQDMQAFHSHSFPEHPDGLVNGGPSSHSINVPGRNRPLLCERAENTLSGRIGIQMSSQASSGFSSSGDRSFSIPENHYLWNCSNNLQSPSLNWPNSPSYISEVSALHSSSQVHGFPRTPSHMTSHHVGSAPTINTSWDRRVAHSMGSPDASTIHQGPLGTMQLSGSPMHHMEFVSRNFYPQLEENCSSLPVPSRNRGANSYRDRSVLQSGRSQMNFSRSPFGHANERMRSRRSDNSSSQGDDKKLYELDLDSILRGEDNRTTLMIKNIPNKYTSKMLMATIDERHQGTYDFIYLPIDFKNNCNVGYAFINMVDPNNIIPFYETFDGKKWEKFNSEKVASLKYGRIQGKQALIAHFQNSSLMNEDKRCQPILFHTDGPNAGEQISFPVGANIRTRTSKRRGNNNEDNQQDLDNKEEFSTGDSSSGSGKESD
ncbi:hypothetical protein Drorol1_Dr00018396 [Drosera rotundifolia]